MLGYILKQLQSNCGASNQIQILTPPSHKSSLLSWAISQMEFSDSCVVIRLNLLGYGLRRFIHRYYSQ